MEALNVKYNENVVYKDKISIQITDVLAKFIWFSHVFFLPLKKNKMFIPANNAGWKWVLDDKGTGFTSCSIKLLGKEDTKSYLAVHYNSLDPAPYPMTHGLNIPEFMGNYVTVIYEDSGCRVKSLVHDVMQPLFIDNSKIEISNLTTRNIDLKITEID